MKPFLSLRIVMIMLLLATMGMTNPSFIRAATASHENTLKIALLPILDAFPFYVAEAEGFFRDAAVPVEAVTVASGLVRDQLMQSNEIDAMLNEITTTAAFNRDGVRVKIVSTARIPFGNYPMFRILSSPNSAITKPRDLANVSIGVAKNTIIEYVTDRLLMVHGVPAASIITQSIPAIPERYQLLMQGYVKAATLPDPLGLSALAAGANEIASDAAYPLYSVSVLSFNMAAVTKKAEAIRAFLGAWNRAAAMINSNPDRFRPLLLKTIRVPPNVQNSFALPRYPVRGVPHRDQWDDVMEWMVGKGLLKAPLPYEASVTKEFLP